MDTNSKTIFIKFMYTWQLLLKKKKHLYVERNENLKKRYSHWYVTDWRTVVVFKYGIIFLS
jgi:hypothetical protein